MTRSKVDVKSLILGRLKESLFLSQLKKRLGQLTRSKVDVKSLLLRRPKEKNEECMEIRRQRRRAQRCWERAWVRVVAGAQGAQYQVMIPAVEATAPAVEGEIWHAASLATATQSARELQRRGGSLPSKGGTAVLQGVVNLLVARRTLTRSGATVATTASGEEALRLVKLALEGTVHPMEPALGGSAQPADGHVDVVLMDLQMPLVDGLLIVALTADVDDGVTRRCLASGFDGVLQKPVDPKLLSQLLLRLELGGYEKGSPPPEGSPAATVTEPDSKLDAGLDSKPAAAPTAEPASANNSSDCKSNDTPRPWVCPCNSSFNPSPTPPPDKSIPAAIDLFYTGEFGL
ncbi:unnamed protein product [Closterium sp. NIES-64]|nr:unnamed protein product [Closterium sp. NIES-64]